MQSFTRENDWRLQWEQSILLPDGGMMVANSVGVCVSTASRPTKSNSVPASDVAPSFCFGAEITLADVLSKRYSLAVYFS